jgi:hypothetical protein
MFKNQGVFLKGKFWNKDLYNNRVIFNPHTAADKPKTLMEFTGYGFKNCRLIRWGRIAIM